MTTSCSCPAFCSLGMRKAWFPAVSITLSTGVTDPGTGSRAARGAGSDGNRARSEVSGGGQSGAPAPPWVSCRTRCAGAQSPASSCASTLRSGEGGPGGGTRGNLSCWGSAGGYSRGQPLYAVITQTPSSELWSRSIPATAARGLNGLGRAVDPWGSGGSLERASQVGLIPAPLCSLSAC